jgi:hypothetical protein
MESKQERLLSRVIVNNLFLSQFEPFRALLSTLNDVNSTLAFGILIAVVKAGGQIRNVLWSRSVSSASHLAWLCLGELTMLQSKHRSPYQEVRALWILDPRLIFDNVEFLLFVELLERISATKASILAEKSGDQLWEAGRKFFGNFSKHASEWVAAPSVETYGQARADEVSLARYDGSTVSLSSEVAGNRSFETTTFEREAAEENGIHKDDSQGGEGAVGDRHPPPVLKSGCGEDEELRMARLTLFQELSAAGLERLMGRLRILDAVSDLSGSGSEVDVENSIIDNANFAVEESQRSEDSSGYRAQSRSRTRPFQEDTEVGAGLVDEDAGLISKLTLLYPDLLRSICTNIGRQHYLRKPVSWLDVRKPCEKSNREFSHETEAGDTPVGFDGVETVSEVLNEDATEEIFQLGDVVLIQVQSVHLEKVRKDICAGRVASASQHLRYLLIGIGIPLFHYR